MNLQARRPPGHGNRKALAFAHDILRLRGDGHSLAAIRQALEDAGVVVSISTVYREVVRGGSAAAGGVPAASKASQGRDVKRDTTRVARPRPVALRPPSSAPLPGRGIAEDFMRDRITNPLLPKEPSR